MDVHASPASLPELDAFLSTFKVRFRRSEVRAALERYLTGLLTQLPNKNCDTLAQAVPGTHEQRLQGLLTTMNWDEEELNRQRVEKMIAEATRGNGVLIFDDTGFAKQGKASVGVARQYSGTLGKVGNCQVAVTCCYSDPQASWPMAARLYLPEAWTSDPTRLKRARVPTDVTFQTKPEIALSLLDQARAWGVPHRCVVADADYGDNPNFLAGLQERNERYVVAVRCDFQVRRKCRGASTSQRADQALALLPKCQWRTIRWRYGTKGWLRKKFVALRAWRLTAEGKAHIGWLGGERAARGQPEERKFYWSNLPASASLETLVDYAHRRHAIEQFHEEAKVELGGDQYQGRLWPGFHRHAVIVMLAMSFLTSVELQHRHNCPNRGRPRDPFSPSARLASPCAASGTPAGRAVAASSSCSVVDHDGAVQETVLTENLTK
jgi:SRSO17 transposase